jgi:hypothetical protein
MYILFISFTISLLGIIIMIGRKLALPEGENMDMEWGRPHPLTPDLQKIKDLTNWHTKRFGFIVLVIIIKLHVRSSKFLKSRYAEVKAKIKSIRNKNKKYGPDGVDEKQEVSGFLKRVSDYKRTVRSIKHKIRREEER